VHTKPHRQNKRRHHRWGITIIVQIIEKILTLPITRDTLEGYQRRYIMTKEQTQELAESIGREESTGQMLSLGDMQKYAGILIKSGYFKDTTHLTQGIVKIMAGQELGLAPFTAMKGINIIDGKPELSAGLMGSLIKNSGTYNYRVKDWTNKGCTVVILENGAEVGEATFDETDAQAAGLLNKSNWRSHPKAMYFARALSYAARTYCPDALGGGNVYVEGEISGDGKEEAVVVDPDPQVTEETVVEPEEVEEILAEEEPEVEEVPEKSDAEIQAELAEKMNFLEIDKRGAMRLNNEALGTPSPKLPLTRYQMDKINETLDVMVAKKEASDVEDTDV